MYTQTVHMMYTQLITGCQRTLWQPLQRQSHVWSCRKRLLTQASRRGKTMMWHIGTHSTCVMRTPEAHTVFKTEIFTTFAFHRPQQGQFRHSGASLLHLECHWKVQSSRLTRAHQQCRFSLTGKNVELPHQRHTPSKCNYDDERCSSCESIESINQELRTRLFTIGAFILLGTCTTCTRWLSMPQHHASHLNRF